MAKRKKVPGWHGMTKDQLVKALLQRARRGGRSSSGHSTSQQSSQGSSVPAASGTGEGEARRSEEPGYSGYRRRERADERPAGGHGSRSLLAARLLGTRAARALSGRGLRWGNIGIPPGPCCGVCEVLRDGTTTSTRQSVRDVEIHGGVNNWYIDVHNPPKSYQLDIGYLTPMGRFHCLARSNVVSTPQGCGRKRSIGTGRKWPRTSSGFSP